MNKIHHQNHFIVILYHRVRVVKLVPIESEQSQYNIFDLYRNQNHNMYIVKVKICRLSMSNSVIEYLDCKNRKKNYNGSEIDNKPNLEICPY